MASSEAFAPQANVTFCGGRCQWISDASEEARNSVPTEVTSTGADGTATAILIGASEPASNSYSLTKLRVSEVTSYSLYTSGPTYTMTMKA